MSLDLDELAALAEKCYGGWLVVAASDDIHPDVTAGVVRLVRTVPALIAELRGLRSQLAESQQENETARNALRWIEHLASIHWYGQAFDPQHMLSLARLAQMTLDGEDTGLRDFDTMASEAIERGKQRARELGFEQVRP